MARDALRERDGRMSAARSMACPSAAPILAALRQFGVRSDFSGGSLVRWSPALPAVACAWFRLRLGLRWTNTRGGRRPGLTGVLFLAAFGRLRAHGAERATERTVQPARRTRLRGSDRDPRLVRGSSCPARPPGPELAEAPAARRASETR